MEGERVSNRNVKKRFSALYAIILVVIAVIIIGFILCVVTLSNTGKPTVFSGNMENIMFSMDTEKHIIVIEDEFIHNITGIDKSDEQHLITLIGEDITLNLLQHDNNYEFLEVYKNE